MTTSILQDNKAFLRAFCAYDDSRPRKRKLIRVLVEWLLHWSKDHGYAYPSLDILADLLGTTKTRVLSMIKELEEQGFFRIKRGNRYRSNRYWPNWAIIKRNVHYSMTTSSSSSLGKTSEVEGRPSTSCVSKKLEEQSCSLNVPPKGIDPRELSDDLEYFTIKYKMSVSRLSKCYGKFSIKVENKYFESQFYLRFCFEKWIQAWQRQWEMRRGTTLSGVYKNKFYRVKKARKGAKL